jgi:hypothetical protein
MAVTGENSAMPLIQDTPEQLPETVFDAPTARGQLDLDVICFGGLVYIDQFARVI